MTTTASPLAARLGSGTGMYAQESLGTLDTPEAPTFRTGKAPGATRATKGQRDLLRTMIGERTGQDGVDAIREALNQALAGDYLTGDVFRKYFAQLKAIPRAEQAAAPSTEDRRPVTARRNRYAGKCNQCERTVAAEAGFVARSDEDKWVVWHEVCPSDFPFPEGRYAIDNDDGELRFYHLIDGQVFVMASDTEYPVEGHAAEAIVATIGEDPEAASIRYGREIGACGVCGRTLTNEDSRSAGIGPVCANKVVW